MEKTTESNDYREIQTVQGLKEYVAETGHAYTPKCTPNLFEGQASQDQPYNLGNISNEDLEQMSCAEISLKTKVPLARIIDYKASLLRLSRWEKHYGPCHDAPKVSESKIERTCCAACAERHMGLIKRCIPFKSY